MIIQSKNKYIFLIIITFLTVRIITTSFFNISLDEKWLFGLWQHINKNYLEDNLFFLDFIVSCSASYMEFNFRIWCNSRKLYTA